MCDRYRNAIQQPESDEPLLVVSKAIVLERERRTSKNLPCIDEVDAMVLKVLQPFGLVPLEPHIRIVYTSCAARNQAAYAAGRGVLPATESPKRSFRCRLS